MKASSIRRYRLATFNSVSVEVHRLDRRRIYSVYSRSGFVNRAAFAERSILCSRNNLDLQHTTPLVVGVILLRGLIHFGSPNKTLFFQLWIALNGGIWVSVGTFTLQSVLYGASII